MKLIPATVILLAVSFPATAATVRVHVDRGAFTGPVELQIAPMRPNDLPQWIAAQTLVEAAADATFASIPAGVYIVLASGPQPLQRATAKVVVGAADTRGVTFVIPPRRIDGRVTLGGKPLAGVTVRMQNDSFNWSTDVVSDADGAVRGPLWDGGTFDLAIQGGVLPSLVRSRMTIDGSSGKATFAIDLPARRIRGVIVDERGAAVEGALVVLRAKSGDLPTNVRTTTGPDGVFEYVGIHPGPHMLDVISTRHLLRDTVAVEARAEDTVVRQRIVLNGGRPKSITVVDDHGAPLAGALVACMTGASMRAFTHTDAHGHAVLVTPPEDAGVAWVAPLTGSIATLTLDSGTAATKIVVPAPTASLDVRMLTTDGEAVPSVSLLMRYNGTIVPPAFQRLLRKELFDQATNDEGRAVLSRVPVGYYELWPYNSPEEAEALMASAAALSAPINVNVVTGQNHVTVRIRKHR